MKRRCGIVGRSPPDRRGFFVWASDLVPERFKELLRQYDGHKDGKPS
jgi:hypothetical protein